MQDTPLPEALFQRQDPSADELFYQQARMVTHIDDATINAITEFYRQFIPADCDVLDLMSSWISHLPDDVSYNSVTGHGMNAEELDANPRLDTRVVQNLNENPTLPFESASFDRAMIVVSVQYLTNPVAVMSELHRTLRSGGKLCIAMSHRCFPTKAIAAFQQLATKDLIALIAEIMQRGGFTDVEFIDRSPAGADPLWILVGQRP